VAAAVMGLQDKTGLLASLVTEV